MHNGKVTQESAPVIGAHRDILQLFFWSQLLPGLGLPGRSDFPYALGTARNVCKIAP